MGYLIIAAYIGFGIYFHYTLLDWVVAAVVWGIVYFSGVTDNSSNNKETDDGLIEPPKKIISKKQTHQKPISTITDKETDTEYKHTVTIVDDRDITLESCKKLLQEKGYRLASDSLGVHTIIDSTNNKEVFKGSSPNAIYDWTYSAKNKSKKPIKGQKLDNGFELWEKEKLSGSELYEISNVDYGDVWYDMPRGELPKYFAAKRSNDYDFALLYGADNVEDIKNWAKKQTP